jgi:hypothetical protein
MQWKQTKMKERYDSDRYRSKEKQARRKNVKEGERTKTMA